jgi:hypothetical protein
MAEVLIQFEAVLPDSAGREYIARVCGGVAEDGLWEGWIEFHSVDGTSILRTPRETEQPNREDLEYWATGLTEAYLQGAFERALHPETPDLRPRSVPARPAFDRPAPSSPGGDTASARRVRPHAVLDPFAVYAQGEDVLREELGALDEGHLRNIVRAYDLDDGVGVDLHVADRQVLADGIVAAVERRVGEA